MFSFDLNQFLGSTNNWISIITIFMSLVPFAVVIIRRYRLKRAKKQSFVKKQTIIDYVIAMVITVVVVFVPSILLYAGTIKTNEASASDSAWRDYVSATKKAPNVNDPLKDNNQGTGWFEGETNSGEAFFLGGAYHIRAFEQGSYAYGYESQIKVENVAFQVRVTMLPDSSGTAGVVLGYGSNLMYIFSIDPTQHYELDRIDASSSSGSSLTRLVREKTSLFPGGYHGSTLLQVLMKENKISLYINNKHIDTVSEAGTSGNIGFVVGDNDGPFEAMFQDFKLWT